MLFTRLVVSALCIGAGIAANPRALSVGNGEAALSALQALQADVTTYGDIIKQNAAHTSIFNKNATAIAAIQGAVSNIVTSMSAASQSIQAAQAAKRQLPIDPTGIAVAIETNINNIAFQLVGLGLSILGSITGSQAWQQITNPVLEGFTELTTILGSLLGNVPGFDAISSALTAAFSSFPI